MNHNLPHTLFIADIHLQPDDSHAINQSFHNFLIYQAPKADSLYILGDLFEIWIGDDIGIPIFQKTIHILKKLTINGLNIYLLHGNRDFLMRCDFYESTGINLIAEPKKINVYGLDILIMHGDSLCTDDVAYQRMRKVLRHPITNWLFLRLPQKKRLKIGETMRNKSKKYSSNKSENIMDVNQTAVKKLFKDHPNCQHLIHGHTHRPAHHIWQNNKQEYHRWVLGDWRPEALILQVTNFGKNNIKTELIEVGDFAKEDFD